MRPKLYSWGGWRFEPVEYRLLHGDRHVTLPVKTLDLLALLVARAPRLATKAEILAAVWPDAAVEEGNIAFHVASLRKTFDGDGEPTCIETVRGRGYRFVAPLTVTPIVTPPSTPSLELPAAVKAMGITTRRSWLRRASTWVAAAVVAAIIGIVAVSTAGPEAVLIAPFQIAEHATNVDNFDGSLAQFIVTAATEAGVRAMPLKPGPEGETARAAATRLGAATVLTGAMTMTSGQRWRVSLRLVRAGDGEAIWSWTFDAPYNEHRHQLQEQIAHHIATGLQQRLAELAR
jgi:DNA-binding winged helix-turn-helix (wHTH) protein